MQRKPLLQVNENASLSEIKQAYRKAALKVHPDKGGNKEDFQQLNQEYELLLKVNEKPTKAEYYSNSQSKNIETNLFPKTTAKEIKQEKVVEYYTESKFTVRFSKNSSNQERCAAIFNGLKTRFGFSGNAKENDTKNLHSGSNIIGKITFLGSFVKKIEKVIDKRNHLHETEKFKKIGSSDTLRIKNK